MSKAATCTCIAPDFRGDGAGGMACRICDLPAKHKTAGARVLERETQHAISKWLGYHGWVVHSTAQVRATVGSDTGLPDLIAMHPEYGVLWVEVKRCGRCKLEKSEVEWLKAREDYFNTDNRYVLADSIETVEKVSTPSRYVLREALALAPKGTHAMLRKYGLI